MKKIEAIIRRTKFEEVKEALLAADIEWFSYYEVRGVGKTREGRIYRGVDWIKKIPRNSTLLLDTVQEDSAYLSLIIGLMAVLSIFTMVPTTLHMCSKHK